MFSRVYSQLESIHNWVFSIGVGNTNAEFLENIKTVANLLLKGQLIESAWLSTKLINLWFLIVAI